VVLPTFCEHFVSTWESVQRPDEKLLRGPSRCSLAPHLMENTVEVLRAVGEHPVRGNVHGQGMSEEIAVPGQLGPPFDAGSESPLDPAHSSRPATMPSPRGELPPGVGPHR